MVKYDCNKVKDYVHEVKRMCEYYGDCEGCPLGDYNCHSFHALNGICDETIPIVQKWSDENPEKIKLTKEERTFIECITDKGTTVCRWDDETLYIQNGWYDDYIICIKPTLFPFIEVGAEMSIAELLKCEFEED